MPNFGRDFGDSFAQTFGIGAQLGISEIERRRREKIEAEERERRRMIEDRDYANASAVRGMEAHRAGWDVASGHVPQVIGGNGTEAIDLPSISIADVLQQRPDRPQMPGAPQPSGSAPIRVSMPVAPRPVDAPRSLTADGDFALDGVNRRYNPERLAREARLPDELKQRGIADALIDYGIDEPEARARAATGTEEYAEGLRPRNTSGLSPEEWDRRRELSQRDKLELQERGARLRAQYGTNSPEYRQWQMDMAEAGLVVRIGELEAGTYDDRVRGAERNIPRDETGRVTAEALPGGRERLAEAEVTADAARDSAESRRRSAAAEARDRLARAESRRGAGGARRDSTSTPKKSVAERDRELKAQRVPAAERARILKAEGYNVRIGGR